MTQRLRWQCEVCNKHIADGEGYLELPFADLHRHREEMFDFERTHPKGEPTRISELLKLGDLARWRTLHRRCDSDDAHSYWIGVERCRTLEELLDWTAHLLEKEWLHETNWAAVLRHQIRVDA